MSGVLFAAAIVIIVGWLAALAVVINRRSRAWAVAISALLLASVIIAYGLLLALYSRTAGL